MAFWLAFDPTSTTYLTTFATAHLPPRPLGLLKLSMIR